jgi:phosphoglycerol transferase MdoB-like AlkP superfamily enzyme
MFPSVKDYAKYQLFPLCVRLLLVLLLYSIFRVVFYAVNSDLFPSATGSIFLYGIRFDISTVFYTNFPYILAVLLPFSFTYKKLYHKICNAYFIIVNSFAALLSYIDVAYYPYVLKRMTADIFSYVQIGFDFQALLPSFFKQFWYLVLIFIVTVVVIVYILKVPFRRFRGKKYPAELQIQPNVDPNMNANNQTVKRNLQFRLSFGKNLFLNLLIFILFIGLTIICMRGGLQLRPLTLIDTAMYGSVQNAALIANTPFGIIHSVGKQNKIEKHYFADLEDAEQYFTPIHSSIAPCKEDCLPVKNVVVIVLESFSRYMIYGMDSTMTGKNSLCPFLNELSDKSIAFNGIANGKRTIEALPAIFGGIPTLFDKSYVESSFASNYSYSAVEILKENGFNTLFFHGAKNGSMNIESYCYSIGFEKYYGKNEYPFPADDDGIWGISDRPYLQYVAKILDEVQQPFFTGILTLSSHNPFVLPRDGEGLPLHKGTHPMHLVASYTDYALMEFFETISKYNWFDSTLFVFTGDHTGEATVPIPDNRYMSYQIPIFFYHPLAEKGQQRNMMQQLDIMPSILSYLGIDNPLFSFGQNVFDSNYSAFAVNYLSGIYQYFTDDILLQFDGEKTIGFYNIQSDIKLRHNLLETNKQESFLYEQRLKAILQSYTTRMSRNKLFIER